MRSIKTNPGEFDDVIYKEEQNLFKFSHFTIGKAKAKYHIIHLPDRSCGLYYALRVYPGGVGARRAMKPQQEVTIHLTPISENI